MNILVFNLVFEQDAVKQVFIHLETLYTLWLVTWEESDSIDIKGLGQVGKSN